MMKKSKILLSVVLIFTMLFTNTAWAAEIFQWIIEPSMSYEFVYDIYDCSSNVYWGLGSSENDYDVYDSYGQLVVENAEQYGHINVDGGYCTKRLSNDKYQVTDLWNNEFFTTRYEICEALNENLSKVFDIDNFTWGAVDVSGKFVIEPVYNHLQSVGYKDWILVYGYNDLIFDSQGNAVFDRTFENIYIRDNIIVLNKDENGSSIIIDKKTGKETLLSGEISDIYESEVMCDGVLVSSQGEFLTEKTELLKNKFDELSAGATNYYSIFNGNGSYVDSDIYVLEIDPYTDFEKKYAVNSNGDVILSDFSYIYEHVPGVYKVVNYTNRTTYTTEERLIDVNGNVISELSEDLYPLAGPFFTSYDYTDDTQSLHQFDGTYMGTYSDIRSNGDYMMLKDMEGKVGFAKVVDLPDIDISDKIILFVGEKDTYVYGEYRANDVKPLIRNGRTMVPIRAVAEALDAEVSWNGDMQMVSITRDEISINIVIGDSYATVNGETIAIDSPAFIENGRTYLPVRFVSEALGAKVDWDEKTQAVILSVAEPEEEPEYSEGSVVNGNLMLNNFQYWYEEDPYTMELNEGSIGSMALSGIVAGPENVSDVLIAAWGEEPFSAEEIESIIAEMTDIWKEEFGIMDFNVPFEFITTHPVEEADMGKKMYVLLVGVDTEGNAVGYAVVEEIVNK